MLPGLYYKIIVTAISLYKNSTSILAHSSCAVRSGPQKLDHELECIMEKYTKPVEGQHDGQEKAATHGGFQDLSCALGD